MLGLIASLIEKAEFKSSDYVVVEEHQEQMAGRTFAPAVQQL
jgi:hypothetical protein